jgi:integrase
MTRIDLMGGKVQLYQRGTSRFWQARASVGGKQFQFSTKRERLDQASTAAEDWYLTLRGKDRAGVLKTEIAGPDFNKAADLFLAEYQTVTEGQRSPKWTQGHADRLRIHLRPFFGKTPVARIDEAMIRNYRVHRMTNYAEPNPHSKSQHKPKTKPPARNTLHNELVTLSLVLQAAVIQKWIPKVPDLSAPYNTQAKRDHRAWFGPEEYKQLYEAARKYAREEVLDVYRWDASQVYDFVLFMANTGLRPDEAYNLEHRDVKIVSDAGSREEILEIEVRGKRGSGWCMSMPGAVRPYRRLLERAKPVERESRREGQRRRKRGGEAPPVSVLEYPGPKDKVFPGNHIRMFNGLLDRTGLKFDRDGRRRTAYSLRHTYICFRLMEGAHPLQVANNCRTSVEMLEKHYAIHIKTMIDPSLINVTKAKPKPHGRKRPAKRAGDDRDAV